ncbi:histidine kinase, partial [Pseudomonas sp. MAFF 301514]
MLIGSYSPSLVVISLFVAILASYTALDLSGRIATAKGRAVYLWITGGSMAMGVGVWSMHFIGMLALRLPFALGFDLGITALSLLIAVLSSGFALWLVSQPRLPAWQLGLGALIMGTGIASMHYTGM